MDGKLQEATTVSNPWMMSLHRMHSRIASSEVMSEINSWQDVRSKKGKEKKSNYHNSMLIIRKRFFAMRATSDGKNCLANFWNSATDWTGRLGSLICCRSLQEYSECFKEEMLLELRRCWLLKLTFLPRLRTYFKLKKNSSNFLLLEVSSHQI